MIEGLLQCGAVPREHSGLPNSLLDMEGPPANPLIDGAGNAHGPVTLPSAARLQICEVHLYVSSFQAANNYDS